MIRKDREITGIKNIFEIVKNSKVITLAFNSDNSPYLVPLNYGCKLEDDKIYLYIHGAKTGTKYDFLFNGATTSFEIHSEHELIGMDDKCSLSMTYDSVIGRGILKELTKKEDLINALDSIVSQYIKIDGDYSDKVLSSARIFEIEVTDITGKSQK